MGSKQSAPVTSTNVTKTDLSPEQTELLGLAMPSLRQFAANPPQLPDFSTVAGFDPLQTQGQEQVLQAGGGYSGALQGAQGAYEAAVPSLQGIAGRASDTLGTLTSGQLLSPESNPALRAHMDQAIKAATQPVTQQLTESILPNIRGTAVQSGYGGSRQGIAEGLAAGRASQEVGRIGQGISADLANRGYGQGLDAMVRGLGLAPQVSGLQTTGAEALRTGAGLAGEQLAPALWTSGVGDVRQGLQQQILGEQTDRFNYEQQLPLLMGKELASIVSGVPGAGATVTGTAPGAMKNPGMSAAGGALAGAQLGSMFMPGIGTAAGALGGGLLGYFGGR